MPQHDWVPQRGTPTASDRNVRYRIGRIASHVHGRWLDFGCGDGGYTRALLEAGATEVQGVDIGSDSIDAARDRALAGAEFQVFDGYTLPFPSASFDGVFMNEVLEHVGDELRVLNEVRRVLVPGGVLILISPNRWFPFEGHGIRIGRWNSGPMPIVPWLPERMMQRFMNARNYWPHELRELPERCGLRVEELDFIWPVFDFYSWLPKPLEDAYWRHIRTFDTTPVLRHFGVSTLVVARA